MLWYFDAIGGLNEHVAGFNGFIVQRFFMVDGLSSSGRDLSTSSLEFSTPNKDRPRMMKCSAMASFVTFNTLFLVPVTRKHYICNLQNKESVSHNKTPKSCSLVPVTPEIAIFVTSSLVDTTLTGEKKTT